MLLSSKVIRATRDPAAWGTMATPTVHEVPGASLVPLHPSETMLTSCSPPGSPRPSLETLMPLTARGVVPTLVRVRVWTGVT